MSYEKNEWQTGDTITAEKLNNIEDGITSGGVLIVTGEESDETMTLSKTWNEINEASFPIIVISTPFGTQFMYVSDVSIYQDNYNVTCFDVDGDKYTFTAETADGYPSRSYE